MKHMNRSSFRRSLCGLLASALLFTLFAPFSVYADAPASDSSASSDTLSRTDLADMQLADQAVTALTDSDDFAAMTLDERWEAADEQLQALAEDDLIDGSSIYYDADTQMFTFAYSCGAWGGLLLQDVEDLTPQETATDLPSLDELDMVNGSSSTADIYYSFDDTIGSSRYPYYLAMQSSWSGAGLDTRLHTNLTVSNMRRIRASDLIVFSMHGSYYTYTYGLFWKRTVTAPIMILLEESTWYNDFFYASDLLSHRVIKVNGLYALMPSFFQYWLRNSPLDGAIVISETCDFYGKNCDDNSLGAAFISSGASVVLGFRNTVYATYSRNIMWDTINQLIYGLSLDNALEHATNRYGEDDVVWYTSLTTRQPHMLAAYPLYLGNGEATLTTELYRITANETPTSAESADLAA